MYNIRLYKADDFPMISDWWNQACEMGPLPEMMSEDTSFILEVDGVMAYTVTLYLTNCLEIAYLENFARNPKVKDHKAAQVLADHVYDFAAKAGYKRVIALSYKEKLKERYQELGLTNTINNLSGFARTLCLQH